MDIRNLDKMKDRLFEKRFLLVDDSIEKGGSDEFIERLFLLALDKKEPVNILIRSGGGSVEPGLSMYDALQSCPVETNGYVFTRCHSTGLTILAGCNNNRIGLENSRYLFHSMRTRFTVLWPHPYGVSQEEQVKRELESGVITFERLQKASTQNFKITTDMYKKLCEDGEISNIGITAKKALELGILTEVWDDKTKKWFWEELLS